MRSMSYKSSASNSNSSISPAVWGDLPIEDWALGYGGTFVFDDFNNWGGFPATTGQVASQGPYAGLTTTSGNSAVAPSTVATDLNGTILISPGTTSGREAYMGAQGGVGFELVTPTTLNVGVSFAFECRVAQTVITSTNLGWFVGLGTPAAPLSTGALVTTTGLPLATGDFIGFNSLMNAGASVNACYQAASQAIQNVNAACVVPIVGGYNKLGFRYQSSGSGYGASRSIKYFLNGVELATAVTSVNIAASTFPSAIKMARMALAKIGAGATGALMMDWWALGCSRP